MKVLVAVGILAVKVLVLCTLYNLAYATPLQTNKYPVEILRVVDGDTYDVNISLGFETFVETRVRLIGVDTPEVSGPERPEGLRAKRLVEEWFTANHMHMWLTSTNMKGKYGRWLADFCTAKTCLSRVLIEEGWVYGENRGF